MNFTLVSEISQLLIKETSYFLLQSMKESIAIVSNFQNLVYMVNQ